MVAALFSLPLAVAAGYAGPLPFPGKWIVEVAIDLPLVLPPVVTGYLLLVAFLPHGVVGSFLSNGWESKSRSPGWGRPWRRPWSVFRSWSGRSAWRFKESIPRFEMAARSLGASRLRAFFTVALPLARRGLIAGFMLAFARSLGEFGATIMVAGNIEGKTRTIPLAIYALADSPGGS